MVSYLLLNNFHSEDHQTEKDRKSTYKTECLNLNFHALSTMTLCANVLNALKCLLKLYIRVGVSFKIHANFTNILANVLFLKLLKASPTREIQSPKIYIYKYSNNLCNVEF